VGSDLQLIPAASIKIAAFDAVMLHIKIDIYEDRLWKVLSCRLLASRKILTENQNPVLIGRMKTKTLGLTLALCFLAGAACFAADPQMGHWKLNEAKSKFAPGSPKNTMVVYEAAGDEVKVTVNGVNANGKSTHNEWTGKFDGKNYPVTGDPTSEARSYKKIDDHTLALTMWHHGRVMTTGRIVVSADGKSRTVATNGRDAKGQTFKNTAVYDKQ
jgi:hypothetical protein